MAIGSGDYILAAEGLILVIVVLSLFEIVQGWIDNFHQKRSYKIVINKNIVLLNEIDSTLKELNLKLEKIKELKLNDERVLYYDVSGSRKNIDKFNSFLLDLPTIKSFEC